MADDEFDGEPPLYRNAEEEADARMCTPTDVICGVLLLLILIAGPLYIVTRGETPFGGMFDIGQSGVATTSTH